jgi:CubicO group peptidase (beta-lactamase class C family)
MKKDIQVLSRLTSLVILILWSISISLSSQTITSSEIDSLVEKTLKTFDVPGIAVAIIKDNKIIHSKGYGVRSLYTKQKVDSNTLFGIASNTKAFTTAALGILVDENKIFWDDKVVDYIPEFRLYNPYVTEEFTIRDLLTHRSGLGLGAGDLMLCYTNFTRNDIIHNLRYLKPVSDFRTKFDYDNLLYIVAGEVIARVSGTCWEDFIETRIMKPLNMKSSAASYSRVKDKSNIADHHAPVNGVVQVLNLDFGDLANADLANAAGGIYSNLTDMCKWIIMQMNNGKYDVELKKPLFSDQVHKEMWTPQTIIQVEDSTTYNTHFASYGLGWFLRDVKGYKQVEHTGGLGGMVTQVTLIPELKLGIIVFTNQQSREAYKAITNTILDSYFGIKGIDRIKQYHEAVIKSITDATKSISDAKKIIDDIWKDVEKKGKSSLTKTDDTLYTGTYSDKWFGEVIISSKNGKLWFDSKRSPKLTGQLTAYKGNTFIVKWNERSWDADAYVMFTLDNTGKSVGIKMKAISPLTDFSFDFQDLDFNR